ncbi:DUF6171 family protein [Paenibacillus cisolokensis]|jgi:hypothetical protein|nr:MULTISPECIES: DUF6171 family protein [Paenibacillus]
MIEEKAGAFGASGDRPCKRCPPADAADGERILRMAERIKAGMDWVGEEAAGRRMAACLACGDRLPDGTCRHCGCYVAIRILLPGKTCPHPGGARWL